MIPQISFLLNKSLESLRNSNLESAELYLKQAMRLQPNNPHVLRLLGVIYAQRKQYSEALQFLKKSLHFLPKNALTLSNLGNIFIELQEYDNALDAYDKAIKLDPKYEEAWSNKGNVLFELRDYENALVHHDKAISLKPDYAPAYGNKGNVLSKLKCFNEAIIYYDQALSLQPNYAEAYYNKGGVLFELKRFDEAIAHYDQALSLKPNYHEAWSSKGVVLHELKRFDKAIAHYDQALRLKPDYHEAWSNKGLTLYELKRFDEAIAHYDQALSLNIDYAHASFNKSFALLLQGDFQNGLPLYESRWNLEGVISEIAGKRLFNQPTWLGVEPLEGKIILLYGEQGLGDLIQFCRYAKLVANLGAKVILEVPNSLASLMERLEGVSQLVIHGQELPFFDYQSALLSLPLALKTNLSNIPSNHAYISCDEKKRAAWSIKLGEKSKKRVGLVWSSMSGFKDDSKRSLMLADFAKALPTEGFEYICLQKELKECDREFFADCENIRFVGDELNDFSDTAALVECLDLVVSTCTSVPHLSAALGKETWVLVPYVPDWRWLLDRVDSPWYSAVKLYRQPAIGDWETVLQNVKRDLLKLT